MHHHQLATKEGVATRARGLGFEPSCWAQQMFMYQKYHFDRKLLHFAETFAMATATTAVGQCTVTPVHTKHADKSFVLNYTTAQPVNIRISFVITRGCAYMYRTRSILK